jgi:cell division protein FtsB
LVHQLALDYFAQDVRQNLDEQSQDEHLTLVDVVLAVIFQEFFLVHLGELVLQVDVVRRHLS